MKPKCSVKEFNDRTLFSALDLLKPKTNDLSLT